MCQWNTFVESYWDICWWGWFPYPCKKYRQVQKFCCQFKWAMRISSWWFYSHWIGCANGKLYHWTQFGLFLGALTYHDINHCMDKEPKQIGAC